MDCILSIRKPLKINTLNNKKFFLIITFLLKIIFLSVAIKFSLCPLPLCGNIQLTPTYSSALSIRSYHLTNAPFYQGGKRVFPEQIQKGLVQDKINYYFLKNDLLKYEYKLDYPDSLMIISYKFEDSPIFPTIAMPLDKFFKSVTYYKRRQKFIAELSNQLSEKEGPTGQGIIPDIKIPKGVMPKTFRKLFGDRATGLRVNGHQKLSFGGVSTVTKGQQQIEGTKDSGFPDLKMKQELNLSLQGNIGDKVTVDVKQKSQEETIFQENKINIKYKGYDDDIVQLVEGGDTNLNISGSKYISYSGSSEGLFGIKTKFKFGDLNITVIASKEEGQKSSATFYGTSTKDSTNIRDMDFEKYRYFYIAPPEQLYFNVNLDESGEPTAFNPDSSLYVDDILYINSALSPKEGTVKLYVDDNNANNNLYAIKGYSDDPNDTKMYYFDKLYPNESDGFVVDYNTGIIYINRNITNNYDVGVVYITDNDTEIGNEEQNYNPSDSTTYATVRIIKKEYQTITTDDPYWMQMCQNKYYLGAQNINNDGFELQIYTLLSGGEKQFTISQESNITYAEFLGLDDNGDGIVNGYDMGINLSDGIVTFPYLQPFKKLENIAIYNKLTPNVAQDVKFYIAVKMRTRRDQINLGQLNIIKNSEKITADGQLLKKNVDYLIDYDLGIVTIINPEIKNNPDAKIKIDYEYEPIFAMEARTLIGMRADYKYSKNAKLGGTFLYQSETVRDKKPKLGKEPKRMILMGLDGELNYEPPIMTKLVNWIPLVNTDVESNVKLTGAVAMNIPTPNATKKKQAYIDDMESIVETYPLGISRSTWHFASPPVTDDSLDTGKVIWYNPYHRWRADAIYDNLSEKEAKEYVSILECKIVPDSAAGPNWSGIMKYLGTNIDLSEKKYIELLVRPDENMNLNDCLHINLGYIDEDFYEPELDELNTEDIIYTDGKLDIGEDTGLDTLLSKYEPGYNANTNTDPNGDDFHYVTGSDNYDKINGTEGNNKLDTEDLDANGQLDQYNGYFEYSINFADTTYLVDELKNGWRLYRIPLQDTFSYNVRGNDRMPTFLDVKYARIWFEKSSPDTSIIAFINIDIVGNKWQEQRIQYADGITISDSLIYSDETFSIATYNTQKNPNYTPPSGSLEDVDEDKTELEQSIVIEFNNISEDRLCPVRQFFVDKMNLLKYKKLRFWAYAQSYPENTTTDEFAEIFIQIGADTLNYYQYSEKIPLRDDYGKKMRQDWWKDISIKLSDITEIKKVHKDSVITTGDKQFEMKGNPSLMNIRQITIGLIRHGGHKDYFSGQIFFDDIRLTEPYDDIGIVYSLSLTTKFADFLSFTASIDKKSPNFYTINQDKGTWTDSWKYNLNNSISLNKFLPTDWGYRIPLILNYDYSISKPLYKSNSDIYLKKGKEREQEKSESSTKSANITISKQKKSPNFFVHYLLDNSTLNSTIKNTKSISPTRADTTWNYTAKYAYKLNFKKENNLTIFKGFQWYYLPQNIDASVDYSYNHPKKWRFTEIDTLYTKQKIMEQLIVTEKIVTNTSVKYEILTDLSTNYSLRTTRDLQRKIMIDDFNIGMETNRTQKVNANYSRQFLDFITPSSSYDVTYIEDKKFDNNQNFDYLNISNVREIKTGLTISPKNFARKIFGSGKKKKDKEEEKEKGEWRKGKGEMEEEETHEPKDENQKQEDELGKRKNGEQLIPKADSLLKKEKEEEKKTKEQEDKKTREQEDKKTRKFSIPVISLIRQGIEKFGNIQLNYRNVYNTKAKPMDKKASFLYQIGIEDLADTLIGSKVIEDKYNASGSVDILNWKYLTSSLSADYEFRKTNNKGNVSKNITTTFPSLSLSLTEFEKLIHMTKVLNSSRLNSTYVRRITKTGSGDWEEPSKITTETSFQPLLSWNGNWIKNITTSLSANYGITKQDEKERQSVTTATDKTIQGNIKYSFSAPTGIKIPLLRSVSFKNELTLSIDGSYSLKDQYTETPSTGKVPERSSSDISFRTNASYIFSRGIDGGLTARYNLNSNKKDGKQTRTIEINIWVKFTF